MNYRQQSLIKHGEWKGKIETVCRVPVDGKDNLSLAYTPGVAEPCMAIHADVNKSFELTRRWNTVPVITDGTAVLGLGRHHRRLRRLRARGHRSRGGHARNGRQVRVV